MKRTIIIISTLFINLSFCMSQSIRDEIEKQKQQETQQKKQAAEEQRRKTIKHTGGPGVYVAGSINNKAVLWKNGVAQYLTEGEGQATSVFVSGNDVYVCGIIPSKLERSAFTAILWKNGTEQELLEKDLYSIPNSIFVSGSDVYVAGWNIVPIITEDDLLSYEIAATLWKNGKPQYLKIGIKAHEYFANSVFVSGKDVYVAGEYCEVVGGKRFPKLWKNGIEQYLTVNPDDESTKAYAVYVSNNDIYVAGSAYNRQNKSNVAILWKNGVAKTIAENAYANFVCVQGNDVYVAGFEYKNDGTVAKLWKNGMLQSITSERTTFNEISFYVSGNDIFFAATETSRDGKFGIAKLWKNGIAQNLTDGTQYSSACSVFVVK